jgi:hypothetical protein
MTAIEPAPRQAGRRDLRMFQNAMAPVAANIAPTIIQNEPNPSLASSA